MSKLELRKKMKTLALLKVAIEIETFQAKSSSLPEFAFLPALAMYRFKAASINATPAKLFRHDKPQLDMRRVNRSNKNAKILKPNYKN